MGLTALMKCLLSNQVDRVSFFFTSRRLPKGLSDVSSPRAHLHVVGMLRFMSLT